MSAGLRGCSVVVAVLLAGAAIVLAAYANSYQNELHFDDEYVVESNVFIRTFDVRRFFADASTGTSHPPNAVYRPLVTTSLALDYWMGGGLDYAQFHRTQMALHVTLLALIGAFYARLFGATGPRAWHVPAAGAAAVFFGVHTTATETLNLMHARSELLSAIGVVGSFLLYLGAPRLRRWGVFLVPMAIGALAKSPAVMFVPLLLVYQYLYEEQLSAADLLRARTWSRVRALVWRGTPALLVAVAILAAVTAMDAPTAHFGGGDRVAYLRTQAFVWLHYARLFVLPVGLTADTDWTLIPTWTDTRVVAGLVFVGWLIRQIWTSSASEAGRPVAFGLLWFVLTLLPASSVIPLAEVSNEHRVFFPYIGLTVAVAAALARLVAAAATWWPQRARLVYGLAVAAIVAAIAGNAVGTYVRNRTWHTSEALWADVVQKSPANGRAWMNYGLVRMAQGRVAEARQLFERAKVHSPAYATLEINMGIAAGQLGEAAVAESHFARALLLEPNAPASHLYYGRWLAEQRRAEAALPYLRRGIELAPGDVDARLALLGVYVETNRDADFAALLAETRALVPSEPRLAEFSPERVRSQQAVRSADALVNESLAAYRRGDFRGSIAAARQALVLRADYAEAYNNIAAAHASLGEWAEAVDAARAALRLKPDFTLAANNLRWAETELRRTSPSRP